MTHSYPYLAVELDNIATNAGVSCHDTNDFSETLATFEEYKAARQGYAEKGVMTEKVMNGFPCLVFEKVQAVKSQPRRSVLLIDVGDVRLFLQA